MSEKQELDIGQKMYIPLQQEQGGAYVVDKELTAYVVGVADRLADVSDRHLPYEFVVLNNSAVNAWALPGGKIAINRGTNEEPRMSDPISDFLDDKQDRGGGGWFGRRK